MPLLSDSKGVKIGKSEGNTIGLTDEPNDLFGKIMSLGDEAIIPMFILLTDVPMKEIASFNIKKEAMNLKKIIASLIVSQLYDKARAKAAGENFVNTFQKRRIPDIMLTVKGKNGEPISTILIKAKVLSSKSEWRRLVLENAIHDLSKNKNITNVNLKTSGNLILKIGKKKFLKIIVSKS